MFKLEKNRSRRSNHLPKEGMEAESSIGKELEKCWKSGIVCSSHAKCAETDSVICNRAGGYISLAPVLNREVSQI